MKTAQGYILVVIGGAVLLAAVLLMIFNGGTYSDFSLYGRQPIKFNVGLLMLLSALGGIILLYCVRLLLFGLHLISRGRMAKANQPPPATGPQPTEKRE